MIQKQIGLRDGNFLTVDIHQKSDSKAAEDDGEQTPVVILPGVMSDAHAWRKVARAIRTWTSVAVINRRGRRPSAPLPETYSLEMEVDDLADVLAHLGSRSVVAWSYGALIALHAGNRFDLDRLIAYEPVERPFGADALPVLRDAYTAEDWDRIVEIVNRDISGFDESHVRELRSNRRSWNALTELAHPLYLETEAINLMEPPAEYGARIGLIDLIVGGENLGEAPYGTSFADVLERIPGGPHSRAGRPRTHGTSGGPGRLGRPHRRHRHGRAGHLGVGRLILGPGHGSAHGDARSLPRFIRGVGAVRGECSTGPSSPLPH